MSSLLQRAIELAVRAHAGQRDGGEPYILHPMRVMLSLSPDREVDFDHLRAVAILHDAVERGEATMGNLRNARLPRAVIEAIGLLTHDKKKQSYAKYIERLKPNPLARRVKLADLKDNSQLPFLALRKSKFPKDLPRLTRYAASYQFLADQIDVQDYREIMRRIEPIAD